METEPKLNNIYSKLLKVQLELKAPKTQYNSFGQYNYRNCEDILEAVKPILNKYNLLLFLNDKIVCVNQRYYVEATATLADIETGAILNSTASAREEETKKGMDGSQITGASSSYARKYALNGLFLIDDVKDSDTTNKTTRTTKIESKQPVSTTQITYKKITEAQKKLLFVKSKGKSRADILTILNKYGAKNSGEVLMKDFDEILNEINELKVAIAEPVAETAEFVAEIAKTGTPEATTGIKIEKTETQKIEDKKE